MYQFLLYYWWVFLYAFLLLLIVRVNLSQYAKMRKTQAENAQAVIAAIKRVAVALEKK